MLKHLLAVGVLTAALAAPALAQDSAAPDAPKEKKICRSITPTGSIMSKRFCLTKSEWRTFNQQNDKHNDMVRDGRNRGVDDRLMGDRQ